MVQNFEEQTEDLTELELIHLNEIKEIINNAFRDEIEVTGNHGQTVTVRSKLQRRPIKQDALTDKINYELILKYGLFTPLKINSARLRKYFSYFRCNGILPIIATKDGCYLSQDREEIQKQILSLEQRSRQIAKAADGMKKFLI